MNDIKYMNNINNVYIINYINIDKYTNNYNNNYNMTTKLNWCMVKTFLSFSFNFNNNCQ